MNERYIIAFDQGTTSTRAVLFNEKGEAIAISQKELKQHYPQTGWVEHSPNEIYEAQKETFYKLIETSKIQPKSIKAIGITNQRETTVVWDKETGEPIYNAIVWLDNRTKSICNTLKEKELSEHVKTTTGLVIDSYFSATKIKWILDNVAGAREKAKTGKLLFGTIDSWLIYKFTKEKNHLTDHTNASRTMLYDIHHLKWDKKLLKALDIPKTMLPKVQRSSSNYGTIVYKEIEIPVLGVAGDQQSSLFGHGGHVAGIAKNTYGTGCFMLLNAGKKHYQSKNGLLTTLTVSLEQQPINYALEGSVFIGGAAIQWLRDGLKIINTAEETDEICAKIPPLEGLYFVPAFTGLGAPYWDENAKGAMFGLTLRTGREQIIKATIESLALQTKDLLTAMIDDCGETIKILKVDGGACKNNYLMQFQADILNIPIDRPKSFEITALGVALLAGIKAGVWSLEETIKLRETNTVFRSKMTTLERNKKYKGWQEAINRTKTTISYSPL